MARFTGLGNILHRLITLGGVVVGDKHQRERHGQADQGRNVVAHSADTTDTIHDRRGHGKKATAAMPPATNNPL